MQTKATRQRSLFSSNLRATLVTSLLLLVILFAEPGAAVRAQRLDPPIPASPGTNQSSPVTVLVGWLTIVWGDPKPGSERGSALEYLLIEDNGQVVRLLLTPELRSSWGGLLKLDRKRVVILGRTVSDSTFHAVAIYPENQTGMPAAESFTTSRPWISILCKFPDIPGEPNPLSYFQNMYGSSYPGMDHYWREVSYDAVNVLGSGAVGWYTLPQPWSYYVYDRDGDGYPDLDHGRAVTDCTAVADPAVHFPDFSGINLMFNSNLDCCAWGGGWYLDLDGEGRWYSVTWEPPWGYQNVTVIAHEMGHGFGLPHSSGMYGQVYDNAWDVMSDAWRNCDIAQYPPYGCLGQHTIAHHKDMLGWIPESQKYVALSFNQTVTLEQLALPQTGHYKLIKIPIAGSSTHFYTVEVRRQVGYDFKLPGSAVIIHEVDTNRLIPAQVVDVDGNGDTGDAGAMWTVGETFDDPGRHISVSITAATTTGYVITIQQQPMPVRLAPDDNRILLPGLIAFSWTPIPDASGYDIQIDNIPTFDSPNLITASVGSPHYSHNFNTLGTWYWRVRALPGGPYTPAWQFRITNAIVAIHDDPGEDNDPALAATANGQLISIWERSSRLWLARSTDEGATWSTPILLTQQCCYSRPALLRRSNNHLWLAYTLNGDVWYQISSDDGASWSSARQVTSHPDYDGEPDVAEMANGEMWIVWKSDRNGQSEIWYSKSANGGAIWSAAAQIPIDPSWQGHPTIAQAPDGKIWVFWFRGYGLAYSVTNNGGVTWSPLEYMQAGGPILAPNLRRGADGSLWLGYTLVYWMAGAWRTNLNFKTSGDNGVTWSDPQQFTRFAGDDVDVAVAPLNDGAMALAWRSNRTNNFDIWFGMPGLREDVNPPPYVWPMEHLPASHPDSNDIVTFRAWVLDEVGINTVSLVWSLNGHPQPDLAMVDDGQNGDGDAGDGLFGALHQPFSAGDAIEYRSRAVDSDGNAFVSHAQWFTVYHWADFNRDGQLDIFDLTLVATCWSQPIGGTCSEDCDSDFDGDIDIADIMRVAAAWSP